MFPDIIGFSGDLSGGDQSPIWVVLHQHLPFLIFLELNLIVKKNIYFIYIKFTRKNGHKSSFRPTAKTK